MQRGVVCYSVCCVLSAPQPWACRGAFMSLELQCGVVCCSMSQCVCTSRCVHVTCVAVRRSVLQYVTVCVHVKVRSCHVCCSATQCVAVCHSVCARQGVFMSLVLQCDAVCCSMSQCVCSSRCILGTRVTCVAERCRVLQRVAEFRRVLQCARRSCIYTHVHTATRLRYINMHTATCVYTCAHYNTVHTSYHIRHVSDPHARVM